MRKIRYALGIKMKREELNSSMWGVNVGMEEVKVVTYEDSLNIAMRTLEKL